jgi:hypothetical protein
MIVVVPAPNYNNAPSAMVDNNTVMVTTIASAMSRNATSLLSTWTAAHHTSSTDANPSSLPWPPLRIFSPWGGVLLVMVIRPLCHRIALQSDSIIIPVLLPRTRFVFCNPIAVQVIPLPIWWCPSLLFDWSGLLLYQVINLVLYCWC